MSEREQIFFVESDLFSESDGFVPQNRFEQFVQESKSITQDSNRSESIRCEPRADNKSK